MLSEQNKYVKLTKITFFRKILQSLSLGLVAILTTVLGNGIFIHHTNTAVIAAVPLTWIYSEQTAFISATELVQAGKQRYQAGQFANAIEFWRQAEKLIPQSDSINQAVVLTNERIGVPAARRLATGECCNIPKLKLLQKSTNQNLKATAP